MARLGCKCGAEMTNVVKNGQVACLYIYEESDEE